jgi:hypothetical protein
MTELAVIDNDPVAPEPLTKAKAKALDKKIRAASDKVSTSTENLLDLLEEAAAGNIHEALELPSWTAWFADAVQISISDKHERKELVKLMSGKGMSQRAIAGTLGVSQKTVDRDLDGEQVADGETVTGLNGVEKPKTKAKAVAAEEDPGYIDAEARRRPGRAVQRRNGEPVERRDGAERGSVRREVEGCPQAGRRRQPQPHPRRASHAFGHRR